MGHYGKETMNRYLVATLLVALGLTFAGCSAAVNTITGGSNLKTVSELWSDVPRMDGLAPSQMEMPVYGKLLMKTMLNQISGEGTNTGDWIVFSTTGTPDTVKNFYTNARMAANGWEPSQNSTCLSGSEQGVAQVGVLCVFDKHAGNKDIGLLIIAAQDSQTKETTVLFIRVEGIATPVANTQPTAIPNPTRGEITPLKGSAPYGIEKRPLPTGLNLDLLLPKQVGPYTRASIEMSTNRGVPPTAIEVDGNSVYAHYQSGGTEIFVEFAVNSTAANAQSTLENAASETLPTFPTDPKIGSLGTEPAYLRLVNADGAFFAWTRGGYYFSAAAKSGQAALDAFMQAFPY